MFLYQEEDWRFSPDTVLTIPNTITLNDWDQVWPRHWWIHTLPHLQPFANPWNKIALSKWGKTNKEMKKKKKTWTESRTILTKCPPTPKLFAREPDGVKQSAQWCQQLCERRKQWNRNPSDGSGSRRSWIAKWSFLSILTQWESLVLGSQRRALQVWFMTQPQPHRLCLRLSASSHAILEDISVFYLKNHLNNFQKAQII